MYVDYQQDVEKCYLWFKVEAMHIKAMRLDHTDGNTKDAMLMYKFWCGLKSSQLRIATRHKYNSVIYIQNLVNIGSEFV